MISLASSLALGYLGFFLITRIVMSTSIVLLYVLGGNDSFLEYIAFDLPYLVPVLGDLFILDNFISYLRQEEVFLGNLFEWFVRFFQKNILRRF